MSATADTRRFESSSMNRKRRHALAGHALLERPVTVARIFKTS